MTGELALFRCDASPAIGAGHVMRCLALGEELASFGFRIAFAVRGGTRQIATALEASGFEIVDLVAAPEHESEELANSGLGACRLLVVDHYERDESFESSCRSWTKTIACLDDRTGRAHDCDVLIDAGSPSAAVYSGFVPAKARVLAGVQFALLRRPFLMRRPDALDRRDGRPVRNVLISFGATDPSNVLSVAMSAFSEVAGDAHGTVVLASRAPHREDVERRLGGCLRLVLDPQDMPTLMSAADIAVGAAGVTAFERAVLGLPSIIVITAENQRGIATTFDASEAGVVLDREHDELGAAISTAIERLMIDKEERVRLARRAASLVDGLGARRAASVLMECMA